MRSDIPPVRCPRCGERQNRFTGEFDPDAGRYVPVDCMVCGYSFGKEEYLGLLAESRREMSGVAGTGGTGKPGTRA